MNWLKRSLGQSWPPLRYDPQRVQDFNRTTHQQQLERDRGLARIFGYEDSEPQPLKILLIDGTTLARNSDCERDYRSSEQYRVQKDTKRVQLTGVPDTDRLVEVRLAGKLINPKLWSYNTGDNELLVELTSIFPVTINPHATLEVDFCDSIPF